MSLDFVCVVHGLEHVALCHLRPSIESCFAFPFLKNHVSAFLIFAILWFRESCPESLSFAPF